MVLSFEKPIKVILMTIGKINSAFIPLIILSCNDVEPKIRVFGEGDILSKTKINVTLYHENNGLTTQTLFYNGKLYNIDNQNILRYTFYISYNDSLATTFGFDNLHDKIQGKSLNDIYILKEENALYVKYIALQESKNNGYQEVLIPIEKYYSKDQKNHNREYKSLFTDFYQ